MKSQLFFFTAFCNFIAVKVNLFVLNIIFEQVRLVHVFTKNIKLAAILLFSPPLDWLYFHKTDIISCAFWIRCNKSSHKSFNAVENVNIKVPRLLFFLFLPLSLSGSTYYKITIFPKEAHLLHEKTWTKGGKTE